MFSIEKLQEAYEQSKRYFFTMIFWGTVSLIDLLAIVILINSNFNLDIPLWECTIGSVVFIFKFIQSQVTLKEHHQKVHKLILENL